ncbi:tolloid-like protein 1 [Physella acuta]|uniref:tolloid-like protein 1 n=1 Tax=Physella acuta TaxID=109671 RepID=UPI0027DE5E98|nr:tolloid-like protein 1 [Physella acuta]
MRISRVVTFCILISLANFVVGQTFTECGGILVGPGGTISSPNYPSIYPNNARCNWTITAQPNEIINLEFKTVDFDGYVDACPDYVVIYGGDSIRSPVIRQLCRSNTSTGLADFYVRSTSNKVYVNFTSDAYNQRQGFLANYWTHACPPMTYGPERCTQNCGCVVEHTVYCNNFNGSCTCKKGWTSPTCGTDVDECADPLIEACPRNYQVCRNNIGGFDCDCQAGLVKNPVTGACEADSSRPCTGACPGLCGKITLPGQVTPTEQCYCPYNTKLVGNQCVECTGLTYGRNCERSCSTCVKNNTQRCDNVTGQCICLPGWSGSTCADDVDECSFSGNLKVCRETTGNYYCVNTPGSYRCDCFQGFEKAPNGTCVRADYASGCKQLIDATDEKQILKNPGYPTYINNTVCYWAINAPVGYNVSLRFTEVSLDTQGKSFLKVYNPKSAFLDVKGPFSGTTNPNPITSTENIVYVLLQSDGSVAGKGFNATFLRCLPFYYGEEKCTTPCNCVKNNTQYCDSFNGSCTCYPGWQSATCADDVDECLSNPCYLTEKCVNTVGSYRCIPAQCLSIDKMAKFVRLA